MKPANRLNFRVPWHGVRRIAGREQASTLLEFAWVFLFILAPLLVGIVYGGITFYDYEMLANAVSDGASVLASSRINNDATGTNASLSPCTAAQAAVKADAYTLNQSDVIVEGPTFVGPNNTVALSSCPTTSNGTTTGGLNQGDFATLSATYPCWMNFSSLGINLCNTPGGTTSCPSANCISAQVTVRIE